MILSNRIHKHETLKRVILILAFGYSVGLSNAQIKDIGLPFISNFPREQYQAGTQNWSITQDANGLMYFANNTGVLRFDGHNWDLFPLPNNSVVRVVNSIETRLYVGGFDEFGYFEYSKYGKLNYHSLSQNLPDSLKSFGEIWRIYSTRYGIVFQSYEGIFLFSNETITTIRPKSIFGFSYFADNHLFVVDREYGLFILQGSALNPILEETEFFMENEVTFIVSQASKEYLIGTTNNGVFIFDGKNLRPWQESVNNLFIKNQIYSAIELDRDKLAIGTIQDGIFIIHKDGDVLQHINRFKGLQNNTVLSLFKDSRNNLWLGLDNGIDYLEISSPISILNYCYNIETAYTSIVHNGILYIGTNQGLFAKEVSKVSNANSLEDGFKLVKGTQGQVWKLKLIDNTLFCGHNLGSFIIKGFSAQQITDIPGGWDFVKFPDVENLILGGTYNGLVLFEKVNGTWQFANEILGFDESSREILIDNHGFIWMIHGYKGLFKIKLDESLRQVSSFTTINKSDSLPELPNSITIIKDEFQVVGNQGIYRYNYKKQQFEPNDQLNKLLGFFKDGLSRVIEDYFGDIWYFTPSNMGVYRLQEDGNYVHIEIPFHRMQNQFLSNAFENLFTYDSRNVFVGGQRGMLHYNQENTKEFETNFNPLFSLIQIKKRRHDSTVFHSYGVLEEQFALEPTIFPFAFNSIHFEFVAPVFEAHDQTLFSFRLKGFDDTWSDWTAQHLKEYTNLMEGKYVFELKAKNIYEKESEIITFDFIIEPPFYRSRFAYIIYSLLFVLLILILIRYFKKRVDNARRHEKLKHERVLQTKEMAFKKEVKQSEAEIERLQAEKLKGEMRHKNMELANATMHLIQKNKFLMKLKGDLNKMWGEAKVESVKYEIKKIVSKIDKDFKNEQHWEVFDAYFDEVHQDFIHRLKEKHPALTPNDLRLCAYLRMNLSTKEIAPLMNISVRGLEISRYRLRKKLELSRDLNLTEYILNT